MILPESEWLQLLRNLWPANYGAPWRYRGTVDHRYFPVTADRFHAATAERPSQTSRMVSSSITSMHQQVQARQATPMQMITILYLSSVSCSRLQ